MAEPLWPVAGSIALIALLVLAVVEGVLLFWVLAVPAHRAALARALRHAPRRGASRYWLRRCLGGIDRLLHPGDVAGAPRPRRGTLADLAWQATLRAPAPQAARDATRHAVGWPVADLAMKLAVACPLLLAALEWALTAEAVRLGDLALLPGHPALWLRLAVAGLAALLLLSALPVADRFGAAVQVGAVGLATLLGGGVVVVAALALAATGLVAVAVVAAVAVAGVAAVGVGIAGSAAGAVAGALAFSAVFALSAVVGGAVAFAAAGSLGVAAAGGMAMAGLAVVAVAVLLPLASALVAGLSGAGAMALAAALVLGAAAASAGTGALPYGLAALVAAAGVVGVAAWLRRGGGAQAHAALGLLLAATVALAAAIVADGADAALGLIVVLGLLPLVKAAGDATAIGKARWLLRRIGTGRWPVWPTVALDLLLGLLILAACAMLALAGAQGLNLVHRAAGATAPVLDLTALLADMAAPGALVRHGWLLAALSTVLLPSLLIAATASFGLGAGSASGGLRALSRAFPAAGQAWRTGALARVAATLGAAALVATALPLAVLAGAASALLPALPGPAMGATPAV